MDFKPGSHRSQAGTRLFLIIDPLRIAGMSVCVCVCVCVSVPEATNN